jgi:hypothetical protein
MPAGVAPAGSETGELPNSVRLPPWTANAAQVGISPSRIDTAPDARQLKPAAAARAVSARATEDSTSPVAKRSQPMNSALPR